MWEEAGKGEAYSSMLYISVINRLRLLPIEDINVDNQTSKLAKNWTCLKNENQ